MNVLLRYSNTCVVLGASRLFLMLLCSSWCSSLFMLSLECRYCFPFFFFFIYFFIWWHQLVWLNRNCFTPSDLWKDSLSGRHRNQSQQQLPDIPSGCSNVIPVSVCERRRGWKLIGGVLLTAFLHLDVLLERVGRKSWWHPCMGKNVTPSLTSCQERNTPVGPTSLSFISLASTVSVPFW